MLHHFTFEEKKPFAKDNLLYNFFEKYHMHFAVILWFITAETLLHETKK